MPIAPLALALPLLAPAAPEGDPLLRAVPADAVLVAVSDELAAVRDRAATSDWVRLLASEGMRPTWDALSTWLELDEERGATRELLAATRGRTAAFVVLGGEGGVSGDEAATDAQVGEAPGDELPGHAASAADDASPAERAHAEDDGGLAVGVLVEPGADRARFDAALVRWLDEAWSDGALVDVVPHGDLEVQVLARAERHGGPGHGALVRAEEVVALALAERPEAAVAAATGAVDRYRGAADGDAPAWAPLLDRARASVGTRAPALEVLVDLRPLLARVRAEAESLVPVLEPLGVLAVEWAYLAADVGAGEAVDVELAVHLPPEGLVPELAAALEPLPDGLAAEVPAGAVTLGLYRYDVRRAWETLWAELERSLPDEHAEGRALLEAASEELGVDVEAELVRRLRGTFVTFTTEVPEAEWRAVDGAVFSEAGIEPGAVPRLGEAAVVHVDDAEAALAAVDDVLAAQGLDALVSTETLDGREVRVLGMPKAAVRWAAAGERIVVSAYPSALAAGLAAAEDGGASILDDGRFSRALDRARGASIVSVSDSRRVLETLLASFEIAKDVLALGNTQERTELPLPPVELVHAWIDGVMTTVVRRRPDALTVSFSAR